MPHLKISPSLVAVPVEAAVIGGSLVILLTFLLALYTYLSRRRRSLEKTCSRCGHKDCAPRSGWNLADEDGEEEVRGGGGRGGLLSPGASPSFLGESPPLPSTPSPSPRRVSPVELSFGSHSAVQTGTSSLRVPGEQPESRESKTPKPGTTPTDLASLAERGRVGVDSSSSGSGDDDSSQQSLRHRVPFRRQSSLEEEEEEVCNASPTANSSAKPRNPIGCQLQGKRILLPREHRYLAVIDATEHDLLGLSELMPMYEEGGEVQGLGAGSKCGSIEAAFSLDALSHRINVAIVQARNVPPRNRSSQTLSQVRLLLLPSRKQRHSTRILPGENPVFHETFIFTGIFPGDVNSMGVRLRLYGCERLRRERLIGEIVLGFASLNLDIHAPMWLTLEPRHTVRSLDSRSDISSVTHSESTGSSHSESTPSISTWRSQCSGSSNSGNGATGPATGLGTGAAPRNAGLPELLLGLSYSGVTGRLAVDVIKGNHFRHLVATRSPDSYVRVSLISSNGQEISGSRTSARRGQNNPVFKESFLYTLPLFQIGDVTLMVMAYSKRGMKKKEMIGWFSLGHNSSGEEEFRHWEEMREAGGQQVCLWHVLLDSLPS
ncbi:unnamed protein product [Darwinula stevensoni]|uniref:C2 domain-containing protein n=1 Tax=Darwinula stevensoni TaxID=69355 RepID=A0A7R8X5V5_9CRUS|nr:unnamed protein product [Darwinula stevensoni]CAG0880773.1 unnamed protein product [Darwinula stevensoni]